MVAAGGLPRLSRRAIIRSSAGAQTTPVAAVRRRRLGAVRSLHQSRRRGQRSRLHGPLGSRKYRGGVRQFSSLVAGGGFGCAASEKPGGSFASIQPQPGGASFLRIGGTSEPAGAVGNYRTIG